MAPTDHTTSTGTTTGTSPRTMRAVVQDGYGTSDVLRVARVAEPSPTGSEVLVRVHAAGLDRGTWHLMTGKPYALRLAFGLRRPRNPVLGRDVAGTVAAVGPEVTRFAVGDEVYGVAPGSFAELAKTKEAKLAHKPEGLSFEEAAVVPISGLTALEAVVDRGRVAAGQNVLVIGASGGVGSYAVQLAAAYGAEVTGVASTAKLDLVRSLGATHVVDYTTTDFAESGERYDLIIDIGGSASVARLRRVLAPTGTLVFTGGEGGDSLTGGMGRQLGGRLLSLFVRQRLTGFVNKERGSDLERLTELVEAGTVRPSLDEVVPLERAPEAMRRLEDGAVRGKIAITVRAAG
jgi:NADPH:quinone reductase-like Zn-dependent oxidoreductase